jgi:xylulokinase
MRRACLGIDVGTSSVKAVCVGEDGETLAAGSARLAVLRPSPLAAEQDPRDWWAATQVAVAEVRAARPDVRVEAVGLTGQKHALLPLDGDLRPLGPAWLWCDGRAADEARRLAAEVPDLARRTGMPALAGYLVPKWHAWRRRNPKEAARVAHLCFAKDWLRLAITGERATDPTEASTTQVYAPRTRSWSADLATLLDLPLSLLPPVRPSSAVTGGVLEGVPLGVPPGTPVVAGAGDNETAALACGAFEPGVVAVVLGTSATVMARVDRRQARRGLVVGEAGLSHGVVATGVVLDAGGALAWLRDLAFPPGTAIERVVQAAEETPPGPDVPLFLPSLTGARSPVPRAALGGAFANLGPRTRREHLARAVLEGVAAQIGRTVDLLRRAGVPVREVRITSGGGASAFYRRLVAAAAAARVAAAGGREGPARGAALLAASRGEQDDALLERARAWCRPSHREEPQPALQRRLETVKMRMARLERALPAPLLGGCG